MSFTTEVRFSTSKRVFVLISDIDTITILEDIASIIGAEKGDSFNWHFDLGNQVRDEQALQTIESLYKKATESRAFELHVSCDNECFVVKSDTASIKVLYNLISLLDTEISFLDEENQIGNVAFSREQKKIYCAVYDAAVKLGFFPF